jgi:hypothetical protein
VLDSLLQGGHPKLYEVYSASNEYVKKGSGGNYQMFLSTFPNFRYDHWLVDSEISIPLLWLFELYNNETKTNV